MDKYTIIKFKLKGKSFRQIAQDTGITWKTISKYWKNYQINMERLKEEKNIEIIQEKLLIPLLIIGILENTQKKWINW